MNTIEELRRARRVMIICPSCSEHIPASQAAVFDATRKLPDVALEKLRALRMELREQQASHVEYVQAARLRVETAARSVNIGKVVEKIAPALPGFPEDPSECRSLYEPIDFLCFRGLRQNLVESISFVDVKSGRARLSQRQREIRTLVEAGQVSLHLGTPSSEVEK